MRVTLPLPRNVRRADNPDATTLSLWRAVPSVINAKFTAPFQHEATLEAQALAAMRAHSEVDAEPSPQMLARIAEFSAICSRRRGSSAFRARSMRARRCRRRRT